MRLYHNLCKRGLALFMALIMCLSLVQVKALAEDSSIDNESVPSGDSNPTPCEHVWNSWIVTKEATCTEPGEETLTCALCKKLITDVEATEEIANLEKTRAVSTVGHNYVDGHCTVCGAEDPDYPKECSHIWGEWLVTKSATEETEGEETRTCSVCGDTETRPINKLEPQPTDEEKAQQLLAAVTAVINTYEAGGYATQEELLVACDEITKLRDRLDPTGYDSPWGNQTLIDAMARLSVIRGTIVQTLEESGEKVIATGDFWQNKELHWKLTEEQPDKYRLTVWGQGEWPDINGQTSSKPWAEYDPGGEYWGYNTSSKICYLTVEPGVTSIGSYALARTSITSVDLPESVKTISGSAFPNCKELRTVNLPGVTCLNGGSFSGCTKLNKFVVSEDLCEGRGAAWFFDCYGLEVIIKGTNPDKVQRAKEFMENAVESISNLKLATVEGGSGVYIHTEVENVGLHRWNSGKATSDAPCTSGGERSFTCTVCGMTKTGPNHEYGKEYSHDANGHWQECIYCHEAKINEAAHGWYNHTAVEGKNCLDGNNTKYTCYRCAEIKYETTHTYSNEWSSDEENHWKLCSVCQNSRSNEGAHTWNSGEVTKPATNEEDGEKTFTCTVCGKTRTETILKLTQIDVQSDSTYYILSGIAGPYVQTTGDCDWDIFKLEWYSPEKMPTYYVAPGTVFGLERKNPGDNNYWRCYADASNGHITVDEEDNTNHTKVSVSPDAQPGEYAYIHGVWYNYGTYQDYLNDGRGKDQAAWARIIVMSRENIVSHCLNDSQYPVYLTVLDNSQEVPGEPTVSGKQYLWAYSDYSLANSDIKDQKWRDTASGIISTDIQMTSSLDGSPTMGVADQSGVATKEAANGVNWESFLAGIANKRAIYAADGQLVTPENAEKYEVIPYVVKLQTTKTIGWHIDCKVVPKDWVSLEYKPNLPDGMTVKGLTVPDTVSGERGFPATLGALNGLSYEKTVNAEFEGHALTLRFKGWSTAETETEPDNIRQPETSFTVSPAEGSKIVRLYAQWEVVSPKYKVDRYYQSDRTGEFELRELGEQKPSTVEQIKAGKVALTEADTATEVLHYILDDTQGVSEVSIWESDPTLKVYFKLQYTVELEGDEGVSEESLRSSTYGWSTQDQHMKVTLKSGYTLKAVTVDGQAITLLEAGADGAYDISVDSKANHKIVVTTQPPMSYSIVRHFIDKDGTETGREPVQLESAVAAKGTLISSLIPQDLTKSGELYSYSGKNYLYDTAKIGSDKVTDQKLNSAGVVIDLLYDVDAVSKDADDGEGPDHIRDKYQATVKYVSANTAQGTVTGSITKVFTLGTAPDYATTGSITPGTEGVVTTPITGYVFDKWDSDPNAAMTVEGGKTYTYRANWAQQQGGSGSDPILPPVISTPVIPTPAPTPATPGTTITDEETPLAGSVGLNDTDHFAYVIGYDDDTVRPLNNITRAEAATIFFRLMTDEYRQANWSTTNSFTDVSAGDWYNNAVSTCANAGVLKGYNDGTFRPNAPITRAEFASMAAGFMDESITDDGTGDFSDTANHWAASAIRRAAKAGWVTGTGNKFNPDEKITRAEVMTIVNRMLDRTPDKDHMLPEMKKWIDNPESEWYYEAVQEATNEHDYERDDLNVETWTELLTVRDWKALETEWANNGGASAPKADPEPVEADGEIE